MAKLGWFGIWALVLAAALVDDSTAHAQYSNGSVRVRILADQPQLTLHRNIGYGETVGVTTGGGLFVGNTVSRQPVCGLPCEIDVPTGLFAGALQHRDSRLAAIRNAPFVDRPMTLHATYRSRRAVRIGLGIAGTVLSLLGVGVMFINQEVDQWGDTMLRDQPFIAGSTLMSVGLVLTTIAPFVPDRAGLRVTSY